MSERGVLRTWSGGVAPLEENVGEVNIIDLVVQSRIVQRFAGCGREPGMNLAGHTLLTYCIACRLDYSQDVRIACLHHDLHECYTGDLPSPFKALLGNEVREIEQHIDSVIYKHLNTKPPTAATRKKVKHCDRIAGVLESLVVGPPDCDLFENVPEDERPAVAADVERCVPNFHGLVRRIKR